MASRLVIKLFPEILIKSRNLRRSLTKSLAPNIRNLSRDLEVKVAVKELQDHLDVRMTNDSEQEVENMVERLSNMPGIDKIERIQRYPLSTPESIIAEVIAHNAANITDHSFRVNVKRKGNHDFKSYELEQLLAGHLLQAVPSASVDLPNPEVTVDVHIIQDQADMVSEVIQGIGVKQLADFIWRQFSYSHRVKFINVPFEPVVAEILSTIDHTHMGVILKRLRSKTGI